MGFLKRIFSRRSKKAENARPVIIHPFHSATYSSPQLTAIEEDGDAAAARLLRSSSARFAIVNEVSSSDLPPLPHPINNIVNSAGASTTSLASTSTSITRATTYSVRVIGRHKLSASQSSSTAPSEVEQRRQKQSDHEIEASQLLRLRSDPSVASLLDLYDAHGQIAANAFNDSPVKNTRKPVKHQESEGRTQMKRSGSTLRQLLGDPSYIAGIDGEGDISWAERYLGESDITSTVSSLELSQQLPANVHSLDDTHSRDDTSLSNDTSDDSSDMPGISSLEVEVSLDNISIPDNNATPVRPNRASINTPRRASEVFKFLSDSDSQQTPRAGPPRASPLKDVEERSLPDLPSAFSSPSSDSHEPGLTSSRSSSVASQDTPSSPTTPPNHAIPISLPEENLLLETADLPDIDDEDNDPFIVKPSDRVPPLPPPSPSSFRTHSSSHISKRYTTDSLANTSLAIEAKEGGAKLQQAHKVRVIMTVPTTVIVTAPTPNGQPDISTPPTRIPRGPRGQPKRAPGTFKQERPMLIERYNAVNYDVNEDHFTAIPNPIKKKRSHSRGTGSQASSTSSINTAADISAPMKLGSRIPRRNSSKSSMRSEKENDVLNARPDLPSTPVRGSSRRGIVTPSLFMPPASPVTPNSSMEKALSPVGRKLMKDLRKEKRTYF
ncbi:hypothetical protein DL96DRAFT_1583146 [Flagelloscypha sp. PMI_526]|nr:hypothetical protein DL96DRAFT_1583146 [Flagelloscypha sp. PMI_526]